MPLQIDAFLLILRLLLIVLFYLFLMQVVIAIRRDLRQGQDRAGSAKAPASLGHLVVINSGPSDVPPGTSYPLEMRTSIGRGPTNTIRIQHPTVSAENTNMVYQNGVWYIQDAGSHNGTFVNEQPAREPLPAKIGDIVRVGYISFQLKP